MFFKNVLSLKSLDERHLAKRRTSLRFSLTFIFSIVNMSEYGSKVQFLSRLFISFTGSNLIGGRFAFYERMLSVRKTKGKDKIQKFNLAILVRRSIIERGTFEWDQLSNLLSLINQIVKEHYGSENVYIDFTITGLRSVSINISFLDRILKGKTSKIVVSPKYKKYPLKKEDTISIVLFFSKPFSQRKFVDIFDQIIKN